MTIKLALLALVAFGLLVAMREGLRALRRARIEASAPRRVAHETPKPFGALR
ncbi:MAG: hypothetical protein ACFCUS_02540 [Rubrimonas sp.]|uniref:hypothetical protein n=1 Tax=Rubrimonas sp. TaxID=2036015 RepID=UPI002FDDF656